MHFLPHFPLHHVNVVSLLGLTLLLGLVGGELANYGYFFPRISGYIAVGFLFGPSLFNIVTPALLSGSRIFVDISLGLILFDLGRHLDFTWLYHDRGMVLMSLAESALTFLFVFVLLLFFHFPWLHAALVATIAIATSPAVILMVADDLSSKGPVTRRALLLTSLNNLFGLLLFTVLLPITQTGTTYQIMEFTAYRLFGSIFLGTLIFLLTLAIASFIGKRKENQFVLFVGSVMFAIGLSIILKLPSMLTLFTFGVASRNLNLKCILAEIDFGWLAKLFFILFFVITGVHLQLKGLWQATWIVLLFLFVRTIAKIIGIWSFAKLSRLTTEQTWALCFALTPMAGVAVGMSNIILEYSRTLGYELITIIMAVVAILNIIGPIATQLAFIKSGETTPNSL